MRATLVALSAGVNRIGAIGCAIVVKRLACENKLDPAPLLALTRQKYVVLTPRFATAKELSAIPDESTKVDENVTFVDTWTRYVEAPVDRYHRSAGFLETPVALSAGA